jgi:D-3-phosphoglycerate dehydrogenase
MADPVDPLDPVVEALIVDLLQWLSIRERSYEDAMDAWRTSCPKLPVWEDANDRGLVTITLDEINGRCMVGVSISGRTFLEQRRVPGAAG